MEKIHNLVIGGLKFRYGNISDTAMLRAESEIKIIKSAGKLCDLLSVIDFLNWMKTNGILVGPGWSVTPGFLISYVLGLSDLDPLAYGLLSERCRGENGARGFDIWLSADSSRFPEILTYLREVFGTASVELDPDRCYSGLQCYTITEAGKTSFRITADPALQDVQKSFNETKTNNASYSLVSPGNIPLDDTETWNYIASNESTDIFTEDDTPIAEYATRFHPDTIIELAALKSLHTCQRGDLIDSLINRKKTPGIYLNKFDVFDGFFSETYGIPVFQENLLIAINYYTGYDLVSAMNIYRQICKKRVDTTNDIRIDFLEHARKLGRPENEIHSVFDRIQKNSSYLGMKSHNLGWALVKYRQAFWKRITN